MRMRPTYLEILSRSARKSVKSAPKPSRSYSLSSPCHHQSAIATTDPSRTTSRTHFWSFLSPELDEDSPSLDSSILISRSSVLSASLCGLRAPAACAVTASQPPHTPVNPSRPQFPSPSGAPPQPQQRTGGACGLLHQLVEAVDKAAALGRAAAAACAPTMRPLERRRPPLPLLLRLVLLRGLRATLALVAAALLLLARGLALGLARLHCGRRHVESSTGANGVAWGS